MAQKINQKQFSRKYSTSEEPTGDVWLDGKPIYRKTINMGSWPNSTTKTVAHGISYDTVISIYGTAKAGGSPFTTFPVSSARDVTSNQIGVWVDSTNVMIYAGNDRTGYSGYVTIEYTKP